MSPYRRINRTVYKKADGLESKGTSKTIEKAKAHLRVLQGVEHGWHPTRAKAKKKK